MNPLEDAIKSQPVRAFDIYALGPFLVWAAMQKKPLGKWTRRVLFTAGVYTVIYNWKNYMEVKKMVEGRI